MSPNQTKTLDDYRYEFRDGTLVIIYPEDSSVGRGSEAPQTPATLISSKNIEASVFNALDDSSGGEKIAEVQEQDETENTQPAEQVYQVDPISSVIIPDENADVSMLRIDRDKLHKRDQEAIDYHKSLLTSGDTLVYISYPTHDDVLGNPKGYEVHSRPHRVHSHKLLATGSEEFKRQLHSSTVQYKLQRRHKLVKSMPKGVKFVVDLTPPEEGDNCLELVTNLSCSYGLRMWHTSYERMNVDATLVSGEDDLELARKISMMGIPVRIEQLQEVEYEALHGDKSKTLCNTTYSSQNYVEGSWDTTEVASKPNDSSSFGHLDTQWDSTRARENRQFDEAIAMSKRDINPSRTLSLSSREPVPEYCPIRHRAGIVRLLQIIEGKTPCLDSAPKVWTLFSVAHYFDCTDVIKDYVLQWILGNPQIIEILPEACLKMAFGMKNQLLCRAAFSILVSEEALSLSARELHKCNDIHGRINEFGRIREDVDEDIRTRVEYASKDFYDDIKLRFENLVGTPDSVPWFNTLPECQKLQHFLGTISQTDQTHPKRNRRWKAAIEKLQRDLRNYVRGRIVFAAVETIPCDNLNTLELSKLNRHRFAERYKPVSEHKSFEDIYKAMDHREHVMTSLFWKILQGLDWSRPRSNTSNLLLDSLKNAEVAGHYGITYVDAIYLDQSRNAANAVLIEARQAGFFDGYIPDEAYASKMMGAHNFFKPAVQFDLNKSQQESPGVISPEVASNSEAHVDQATDINILQLQLERVPGSSHPDIASMTEDEKLSCDSCSEKTAGISSADPFTSQPQRFTLSSWDLDFEHDVTQYGKHGSSTVRPNANTILPVRQREDAKTHQGQQDWAPNLTTRIAHHQRLLGIHQTTNVETPQAQVDVNISDDYLSTNVEAPRPPIDIDIKEVSPFFGVGNFFYQVNSHIQKVVFKMLDSSPMGPIDISITDTLLCLGPEQFKFLPLWAGGDDDGSGGVFDQAIPLAEAGPNGPGPSFRTGFSLSSAPASEAGSYLTSINTSVGVEDGFSDDHVDRRRIISDDGDEIHSQTFSDDSENYTMNNYSESNDFDFKRKGKAVDRGTFASLSPFGARDTISSTASTATVEDDDMVMSNDGISDGHSQAISESGTEMGFSTDHDFDVDDDDDDLDTAIGINDDDEWDPDQEEESFDFGDSDEEMSSI